jgi:hypothetical protein
VILGDYKGNLVAACTKYIPHVALALMAEALAMKEGLLLAHRMGVQQSFSLIRLKYPLYLQTALIKSFRLVLFRLLIVGGNKIKWLMN